VVTAFLLFLPLTILHLRSVHSGACTAWLRLPVSFGVMPKQTKQIADCEAVVAAAMQALGSEQHLVPSCTADS
jgi:hypothetical protein